MAANINASENTLYGAAENMVTTLAATPCQSASFTNLPVELKECIYLYAIAMDEHYVPSSTPFLSNALGYAIFRTAYRPCASRVSSSAPSHCAQSSVTQQSHY
jgi:hypothetical protein